MHKFIYHNSAIALPILDSQCKCWTFREKITSPGEGPDREKLSRLQWSDKEGEVKLSSEWHKSVWGRIDAQIILYAKTGTPQYITAPEQDIRAAGDMADSSLGVWFELCKGRNECVGGGCVFWLFFTGGRRFGEREEAVSGLTWDSQTRAGRHWDKFIR